MIFSGILRPPIPRTPSMRNNRRQDERPPNSDAPKYTQQSRWTEAHGITGRNATADTGESAVFRKEGDYWTIAYGQRVSRLKDTKGLVYIAYLLRNPGVEFHVLDLVQYAAHPEAVPAPAGLPDREEELAKAGIHIGNLGDAGEVLDSQARSAYRRRLTELREQLRRSQTVQPFRTGGGNRTRDRRACSRSSRGRSDWEAGAVARHQPRSARARA